MFNKKQQILLYKNYLNNKVKIFNYNNKFNN